MLYDLIKPFLYRFDAETAHGLAIAGLKLWGGAAPAVPATGRLVSTVAGITFANPVGMAAGFDKDGEVPDALLGLGFGFAEVGTITPLPQAGNPKPRLFRLVEDRAVINRMGFNNGGLQAAHMRLAARARRGVVGINVGANKETADRVGDYVTGIATMKGLADYITINISSPNTPGLRDLQGDAELEALLSAVAAARAAGDPPIFLKVAPDLDDEAPARIVAAVRRHGIDGIIVSNTTISRPPLASAHGGETGGLSGAPLRDLAQRRIGDFYRETRGDIPLIGVGGIANADDAYARIRAGANLVQVYSAMVYEGPGIARAIADGLDALLARDGFAQVADAVGVDA
ncbi:quinone-dependent dihydroorotate dehydrogenase [Novosphingobium sp. FSY-8]|uniref:Dihydroorotate dehydrogenase (quinone) n=1 Tax=Novosphingobium ovatum TaxID=1908523 RepID=A0ABW9XEV5_9SPHN|nr:quinone-dependent dihydroorotate dehydrogenase [Novosphingobium ovatum]NBC37013.1 quinone-dependent dihydroorotate dehydrogenase [Novosphingobium ovatum]